MSAKFGYWNIRGLAQPIRLLLAYTGTDYEDTRYGSPGVPDWFSIKETMGMPFPNLPYYIDGDIKVTQSNAILRYIGEKNNMAGATEKDRVTVMILENELMDFRIGFARLCYNQQFDDKMRDDYISNVKGGRLKRFSAFLADRDWSTTAGITFVDFVLYESLDQHLMFEPTILDDYPNLKAFLKRFEALPAIKSYIESPQFISKPVHGPSAKWNLK